MNPNNISLAKEALQEIENLGIISPNDFWLPKILPTNEFINLQKHFFPLPENIAHGKTEDQVGPKMQKLLYNFWKTYGLLKAKENHGTEIVPMRSAGYYLTCGLFFKPETITFTVEQRINALNNITLANNIGSCEMQTAVAFIFLSNKSLDTHIEIVSMKDYDHFMIFIGRDPDTDISNPDTWNKELVICDPFNRAYFDSASYKTLMAALIAAHSIHPIYRDHDTKNYGCLHVLSDNKDVNLKFDSAQRFVQKLN